MQVLILTIVLFALAMTGLAIGLIVKGTVLQGSCGGAMDKVNAAFGDHDAAGCGVCSKKTAELCPSDDEFVRIAQLAHPDPLHHR